MELTKIQKSVVWLLLVWGAFISFIIWEGQSHSLEGLFAPTGIIVVFAFFLVAMEYIEGRLQKTNDGKAKQVELSKLQWLTIWIVLGWIGIAAMVLTGGAEYNVDGFYGTGGMVGIIAIFILGIDFLIKWIPKTKAGIETGKVVNEGATKLGEGLYKYIFEPLGIFISGVFILAVIVLIGSGVIYALFAFPLQVIAVLLVLIFLALISR